MKQLVRLNKNGRVISYLDDFADYHNAEFRSKFKLYDAPSVSTGQTYDKSNKEFIDFVEPPEIPLARNRRIKREAVEKFNQLKKDALDLLIAASSNPKVKAIAAKMNTEKGKM